MGRGESTGEGAGDGAAREGAGDSAGPGRLPRHAVLEALSRIGEALDDLDGVASWSLSDTELREAVAGWFAVRSRVDAACLGVVRDLDARPEAVAGARAGQVAATFLIHRLHLATGQAHAEVAAAHAITPEGGSLAGLGAALAAGQVSRAHLDVAVRAVRRIPQRLLNTIDQDGQRGAARIDAYLTEQAKTFCPRTVEQLAARLLQVLDPDRTDRYDPDAYTRRRLTCGTDSTGMTIGQYQLHPAAGAVFKAALDHYSRPAPVTSTDTPDGQQALLADERTPEQRRADALTTISRIALHATTNTTGSPLTHITLIATPEQLAAAHHTQPPPAAPPEPDPGPGASAGTGTGTGTDADTGADADADTDTDDEPESAPDPDAGAVTAAGMADCLQTGPLTPDTLGLLACDALVQAVFLTPSGAVLNLGRTVRTATATQRKALLARDRGCIVPGCTAPLAAVDVHHVTHWRHGGTTDLDNLAMLCSRHHAAVHTGIWSLTIINDLPWVIPPVWLDPEQHPLRNQAPHAAHQATQLGQQLRLWPDRPHPPDR